MLYTALQILDWTYKFKTWTQEGEINWLKKVNIFVGQNNSGKSRFMRSLFGDKSAQRPILFRNYQVDWVNNLANKLIELYWTYSNYPFNSISSIFSWWPMWFIRDNNSSVYRGEMGTIRNFFESHPNNKSILDIKLQENLSSLDICEIHSKVIYIPLLRWLKNPNFSKIDDDIYAKRAIYDYWIDINTRKNYTSTSLDNLKDFYRDRKFEIFSWLTLYDEIKRMLLWNHEQREIIRNFELFLSENFFNNLKITLTPHIDDDVLYIKIGEGKDYPIYDLWDGIQSIIICTFPLFKYKDENVLFFIEEPEIGIHPWMQRILLETLSKWVEWKDWKHQIFFTTHSNHLLDIALDEDISKEISIYQFRDYWDEKHIINISPNKEVLDLLWARNSSIFLSNCIIWVEWISDRIYIKKWLSLYFEKKWKKKFEEDKHFSILEYGGGNVVHFNFSEEDTKDNINVQWINKSNFVIADNDGYEWRWEILEIDEEKEKRLKFLYKKLWMSNFFCELREIENWLWMIWLEKFLNSCDFTRKWIKLNLRSTASINWKNNMGSILRDHYFQKRWSGKLKYFDKQTHIEVCSYSKLQVAESIKNMDDLKFDDLPKVTQNLVKKLYEFIETNNSN